MSIDTLPPLITQTPERTPSYEINYAIGVDEYLGKVGTRQAFAETKEDAASISVLPTREALRYAMDQIHTVVFVDLQGELAEIDSELNKLEFEIIHWADQRRALAERRADLEMCGRHIDDSEKEQEISQSLKGIEQAKDTLLSQREVVLARRMEAVTKLEKLEKTDFKLLQQGY